MLLRKLNILSYKFTLLICSSIFLTSCNYPASNAFGPIDSTFEELRKTSLDSAGSPSGVNTIDCGTVDFGSSPVDVNACLTNSWQSQIGAYGIFMLENNSAYAVYAGFSVGMYRFGSRETPIDQDIRKSYAGHCNNPSVATTLDVVAFICDNGNGTGIPLDFDYPVIY